MLICNDGSEAQMLSPVKNSLWKRSNYIFSFQYTVKCFSKYMTWVKSDTMDINLI